MKVLMAVAVALMLAGCVEEEKEVGNVSVRNQIQGLVIAADSYTMSDSTETSIRTGHVSKQAGSCRGTTCRIAGITIGRSETIESFSYDTYTSEGVHRGVNMARYVVPLRHGVEGVGYGGWLKYHYFAIEEATSNFLGSKQVGSFLIGQVSGNTLNLGRATYNGVMAGMNSSGLTRTQYRGDVQMQYDGNLIDITISNIINRSTNSLDGRTLRWVNVPVSGNTFGGTVSRSNYLRGKFYGPNAEEAGAVFEQQGITGAFGTKR